MNVRKEKNTVLKTLLEEFPLLPALLVTAVLFTLLVLIFSGKPNPDVPAFDETPVLNSDSRSAVHEPDAQTSAESDVPVDSGETTETENASVTDTAAPVTTEAPVETAAPDGSPHFTAVDESYFSDALFIGDSRTDGLALYCPVGDSKHYSAAMMTIYDIMDSTETFYGYYGLRSLLQNMQFGKIYFMLGINECGYPNESFMRAYRNAIEEIRRYQPNAIIYIQSILYVTQQHAQEIPIFESYIIQEKNELIKELANDTDIFYLEVNDALNDGTDHLPAEYTGDGVHLKASYYYLWKDYLLQHAIVNAAHPWSPAADSGNAGD